MEKGESEKDHTLQQAVLVSVPVPVPVPMSAEKSKDAKAKEDQTKGIEIKGTENKKEEEEKEKKIHQGRGIEETKDLRKDKRAAFLAINFRELDDLLNMNDEYNDYSIFKIQAAKDQKIYELVAQDQNSVFRDDRLLNRAIGCIMAHGIGDSLGSVIEFQRVNYERTCIKDFHPFYFMQSSLIPDIINRFRLKVGQYTDDFSMALCVADSLLVCRGFDGVDMRKRFLRWWFSGYNNAFRCDTERESKTSVGLGGNISESFNEVIEEQQILPATRVGNEHTSGNGSIMRLSPVALYYHDNIPRALETAALQSLTTHKGLEAKDCCRILAFIIIKALKYGETYTQESKGFAKTFLDSLDIGELLPTLETATGKALVQARTEDAIISSRFCRIQADCDWNWKVEKYRYSPTRTSYNSGYIGSYAADALTMALHCVYSTNTLKDAMLKSANLGGDADSVTAVTGQIAGALYGLTSIPPVWRDYLMQWDNKGEIALRALCCLNKDLCKEVLEDDARPEQPAK